jgi:FixJ family two-component response regulator
MTTIRHLVAIVDDDPQIRRALVRLLDLYGLQAAEFGSAEDYLAAAGSTGSCMILDVDLPGMSGIDLYRRLQKEGRAPACVFITGKPGLAIEETALALGCVAFLPKPFQAGELIASVRQALEPAQNRVP